MARWDEILSLPVQSPPTLEFSSADIVWSKVEGWRDNIDRVALIPFARVDDFVRGESSNKECPTRFHVEARRRRPPEMPYKPKVDGILEYILYWCSFGPDDHRKGGIVRPSRSTYIPKKKSAGRPNTKRGCTCHFIVKRLIAEPSVALIIYNQDKHVDKKGLPCHGPQDKKAVGTRAMFAPYISDDLRLRVLSLLYVGVSVETIMQRHNESVERQGGPCNRDDLLTHRYVRRLERSIRRSTYELDEDDMVSIAMWVESHQSHVFFYEDFSDTDPFVLGIQTEWQLQQMIRFGNRSLVASDSRFGTNKLKYPVHSLLVFDSDNKAIPVAWIVAPRFASGDAHKWIRALYNRVHSKDPTWKLAGFIVDDPAADVLTIREVFQCSVLICFWRVRHAWHKNLVKKCLDIQMRAEISRRLGEAVYAICKGNGNVDLFEDFMGDFLDCLDFLDYFRAIWFPRIGLWTTALKTLPLASQETSAAMEYYHHQLKLRLFNEKNPSVYQRTDWLVDKLGTKVHSYFWLDEYSGKDDFGRYRKNEWMSGLTSWRQALEITDADVVLEGRCAKVLSQHNKGMAHVVHNPGSEFAICDCNWSQMGNLCKHVIKVSKVCRDRSSAVSSISLFEYNQTLINILHCPPHDSLIRDHAVSLAIFVQMQLNALVQPENGRVDVPPVEKQTQNKHSACKHANLINESQCASKKILSCNENPAEDGDDEENVVGDLSSDDVTNGVACENGFCSESAQEIIASTEMDVDPLSICASPSELLPLDVVTSTNDHFSNGNASTIRNGTQDEVLNVAFHDKVVDKNHHGNVEGSTTGSMMDVDPKFTETPCSTSRAFDPCMVSNGVCSNLANPTVTGDTIDVNPQSIETSQPRSVFTVPEPINSVESMDQISENGHRDLQNEIPGMNASLQSVSNACTVAGVRGRLSDEYHQDDVINWLESDGICSYAAEENGSMMDVCPNSIQNSLSRSRSAEHETRVDNVASGTSVCDNILERDPGKVMNGGDLTNKSEGINEKPSPDSSPTRCEVQDGIAGGGCHSDRSSLVASCNDISNDVAAETVSGHSIQTPTRTVSLGQQVVDLVEGDDVVCGEDSGDNAKGDRMDVGAESSQICV
ncbi:PREDICTED: uncharacterized protein LOC104606193 [Nelumbo nucifera]|uniref:SWIM-type domain-containing protein n=2 Tax=Nelumbo nucifera TaxID=4432 RepID=A0A822YTC6_NELNU|nr:PREDICTED: uncharacterized protein LOC104606193 [Nelumbo nucifera]DAD35750.1 TPA_asm: hypothetical protein HUJ06_006390 [Nelumbo nucifera]